MVRWRAPALVKTRPVDCLVRSGCVGQRGVDVTCRCLGVEGAINVFVFLQQAVQE